MGCTCIKLESDELELPRYSVENIPAKELSQVLPEQYSPTSINILHTPPSPISIYTLSSAASNTLISYDTATKSAQRHELSVNFPIDCAMLYMNHKSFLLFAGGFEQKLNKEVPNCFSLCTVSLTCSTLAPLNTSKRRARLLLFYNDVYCIGGVREVKTKFDTKICINQCYSHNFERYSLDKGTWETLQDMAYGVEYPAVSANGSSIFVLGGGCIEKGQFEVKKTIQIFKPDEQKWEICSIELTFPMFGGLSIQHNDCILVFGGTEDHDENFSAMYKLTETLTKLSENSNNLFCLYYCEKAEGHIYAFNDEDQVISLNLNTFIVDVNDLDV